MKARSGTGLGWTEEHDAALRGCLAESMSFAESAAKLSDQFGIKRSRHSCIGRASRLGCKSQLTRTDSNRGGRAVRARVAPPRRPKPRAPTGPTIRAQLIELRCVPVEPLHLDLLELERGDGKCRYPFGDGPFTFCGHHALTGGPYCGPHAALTVDLERIPTRRRARMVMEAAE